MNAFPRRLAWPWLVLLLVALGAAWLRYGLIESSAIGAACSGAHGPAWCLWREWLVVGFLHNVYGIAALLAAAAALAVPRIWVAGLAAALGMFALLLYGFETGALALLIGCLRLLRLQAPAGAGAPGIEQQRPRQRKVEPQPAPGDH